VKTQLEWFQELAQDSWQRAQACLAAHDAAGALPWLERAHRIAPEDAGVALSLASLRLGAGAYAAAASLLEVVTRRHDVREAWLSLAAARRGLRDLDAAVAALREALSRHVLPERRQVAPLADAIAGEARLPGWCGLGADGRLMLHCAGGARPVLLADGRPAAARTRLPDGVEILAATVGGRHLLGSPIAVGRARRIEGVVATRDGGIEGWAWHPGDPDTDPVLTVRGRKGGVLTIAAHDADMPSLAPLSRPRRFSLSAARLAGLRGPIGVTGRDGRHLMGSPLDPAAELASAALIAGEAARLFPLQAQREPAAPAPLAAVPAALRGIAANAKPAPRRAVAVVVPAYRGVAATLACLNSVFATLPPESHVVVVDDASPEPELSAALDELHAAKKIRLLRHTGNRGFPASANAGMRAAAALPGRPDLVLLNSDTVVTEGWIEGLRAAVHATPDIGTATPLCNDATILSYPDATTVNPPPDAAALARLGRLAHAANAGLAVEIPTAVGACMYIRRECAAAVGLFREDVFAQGYGEENDFCMRARHLGWRHVGVPGVYIAHVGAHSFGTAGAHLIERNLGVLERLHPGYRALIAEFQAADPLAEARRRLDMARWRAGRSRQGAVVFITHDSGGGVERVVRDRAAAARARGQRAILIRPERLRGADAVAGLAYRPGFVVVGEAMEKYPNLRFAVPAELRELARLLRGDRVLTIEVHHLLGHHHDVLQLEKMLAVPIDMHVHDYALFCPRISLVGRDGRYCGEPDDAATCEACVADLGSNIEEKIGIAALRERSAADLAGARRVVVPSADAAARLRRHFPASAPEVEPHEDDGDRLPPRRPMRSPRRVCVVGGIGTEKGYDVLLACARDAARRRLPVEFTVVGHTPDDQRLMDTGRVFVTGPYQEAEAEALIRAQDADFAWLPSIWPETWCFTLGHAWRAGLPVAAFDIGAPADRIRRTGRGWLLPLGLPPPAINNALLAVRPVAGDEC
jgi:GT2 family glycosyltransferase/glycosyltransferase involved in cell wall biosynthesis